MQNARGEGGYTNIGNFLRVRRSPGRRGDHRGRPAAKEPAAAPVQRSRVLRDASERGASISWQPTGLPRRGDLSHSRPFQSRLLSRGDEVSKGEIKMFFGGVGVPGKKN